MSITLNGSGLASGITSVPNLQSFPVGPQLVAANMPPGSVIQVVTATAATFSTSSGTLTATGLSANITPQFASSKILVQVFWNPETSANTVEVDGRLYKNGTSVAGAFWFDVYSGSGGTALTTSSAFYTESPGSTSTITYATYLRANSGTVNTGGSSQPQQMLIMEIR